jgi:hypothetical protein
MHASEGSMSDPTRSRLMGLYRGHGGRPSSQRCRGQRRRGGRRHHWLMASLASVLVVSAAATPASAASTIPVDCTADSAALVVAFANANAGDTLAIEGTCAGALDIAKDITLAGSGAATLDGQGQAIRVLTIRTGATVTVTGLTITGGQGLAGVGIHNLGTLTLTNSRVSGNVASLWGGGIYNRYGATLTLDGSAITGNTAAENGGGLINDGTSAVINSTISGNNGGLGGGGIYNSSFGTLTLSGSVVSGNSATYGGGILGNGGITVEYSTVRSNAASHGGGLGLGGGVALVKNTTIAHNSASGDGAGVNYLCGIYCGGAPPVLRNVTIFGNDAGGSGGGLANTGYIGTATIESSTVVGNRASVSGAGIANTGYSGQVTLTSTIVAAQSEGQNCTGPITDGGYNLDDGMSCGLDIANGSLPGTNPLLDPAGLKDNGGRTQTVALQPASPAIDVIPYATNGCGTTLTIDQRGTSRPQGQGCEIGAFELVGDTTPPVITVPGDITTDATGPNGAVVSYAASATDDVDGPLPVTCIPSSGSTFPIGNTTVQCSATDAAGNGADASFEVNVTGASDQLEELIVFVTGMGPGWSLADKLEGVRGALSAGDHAEACETLAAFLNQVDAQADKQLTSEQVAQLVTAGSRIRAVLDC